MGDDSGMTVGPPHKRRATGLAMLGDTDHLQVDTCPQVDFSHQLEPRVC